MPRPPDQIIGDPPYMRRWYVIPRNSWFNIYYHEIVRSDDDRALHDHPWSFNVSLILAGGYFELARRHEHAAYMRWWGRGSVIVRCGGAFAHRLILPHGTVARTLFITGPRVREWGFLCPQGWRHWKDFTAFRTDGDSSRVGPGCGEP